MIVENQGKKKNSQKILILDDVIINLEILGSIIEDEGYEPLCALSVQEAIDMMNESLPQLILSDISMPEMDGLEFCRLIKSNPRTRDIPVIFITALNTSEEKEQAFLAGAVDFITKPFDHVEVVMRVKTHLNSYQMKKEMEKSQTGAFPQYFFVFRDDRLIGYMFLIAEKEKYCKAFPWWAVHNSDELPLEISIQLLEYGISLCLEYNYSNLANRLKLQLESQKKGIGRRPENLCR